MPLSFSSTVMLASGKRWRKRYAVASPTIPAPTTTILGGTLSQDKPDPERAGVTRPRLLGRFVPIPIPILHQSVHHHPADAPGRVEGWKRSGILADLVSRQALCRRLSRHGLIEVAGRAQYQHAI